MEYYSAINRRQSAIGNNTMDLSSIMLSKISQEKDKLYVHKYMEKGRKEGGIHWLRDQIQAYQR